MGAILWFRISQAPGWRSTKPFAWVSLTASGYCLADTTLVFDVPNQVYVWSQHISMAFGAAHAITWIFWFAGMDNGRRLRGWERIVVGLAVVLMAACLIPGVIITDVVRAYSVDWLGVTYHIPEPTTLGFTAFLFFIGTMWIVAVTAYRRWRAGWRGRYPVLSVSALSVLAVLDVLSTAGHTNLPLMVDLGFLLMITGFGLLYLGRFLDDMRRLERLSAQLEQDVESRNRELSETQGALARSEMLAAVGRLAAGVAHEINNPAAVVLANLSYLQGELDESLRLPKDGPESLKDASEATLRIAAIVRRLVDATQGVAKHEIALADVSIGRVMLATGADAESSAGIPVSVEQTDLVARADAVLLEQVLQQLIANATEAANDRGDGHGLVSLCAVDRGERVEIQVKDNGRGVSSEQRERLFELFNTSRLTRKGTGLGLAVANGLTKAQGGSLRLVESSSGGTTFAILLPAVGAHAVETREFRACPDEDPRRMPAGAF